MSGVPVSPPQGRAAPVLVLCRQCLQYVFEGTTTCPHCGGDAGEISARYSASGHLATEAIERIERITQRRRG